jgi:hypothetical protein
MIDETIDDVTKLYCFDGSTDNYIEVFAGG